VADGGTGSSSFTKYAPVIGGTDIANPLQSAGSGISNVGYILTSTGDASAPTWQAAGGGLSSVTVNISSAQIKDLANTPIQILAAQGANTIIVPVFIVVEFIYSAPAYTSTGSYRTPLFIYGNSTPVGSGSWCVAFQPVYSFFTRTISGVVVLTGGLTYDGTHNSSLSVSESINQGIYVGASVNPASGNGTLRVTMSYSVISTTI